MNVYVFGNEDLSFDNRAIKFANKYKNKLKHISFININLNEDLPFENEKSIVILDTVLGIDKVTEIKDKELDRLILNKSLSAHDYDLGFQLKYLKKLGKIREVTVIGIPQIGKMDYFLIQSILRKLVAQDMQGS